MLDPMYKIFLNQWATYNKNHTLAYELLNRGYHKIAIFGAGAIGRLIYEALADSPVEVLYFFDETPDLSVPYPIPIIADFASCAETPPDMVIIATLAASSYVQSRLAEVFSCDMESIHNIIAGGDYLQQLALLESKYTLAKNVEYKNSMVPSQEKNYSDEEVPSVFIVTLPKSGTVFLSYALQNGLNLQWNSIGSGRFPHNIIYHEKILEFLKGGQYCHLHMAPHLENVLPICLTFEKFILNIRDPRGSVVSMYHYMNYILEHDDIHNRQQSFDPQFIGWNKMSEREKIEHVIGFYYDEVIQWLGGWFDLLNINFTSNEKYKRSTSNVYILDTNNIARAYGKYCRCGGQKVNVLLTCHESLVLLGDEPFIHMLLDFLGIPRQRYVHPDLPKDMRINFRKGRIDSWKNELTEGQQERLTRKLPQEWREYFGWA